jgi:drug/metabolite transporter (DMT)-like permease
MPLRAPSPTPRPDDAGHRPAAVGAMLICVSATLWGLDGVVLTPRLHALPVLLVVFLLHAVPFLIMQPFLWRSWGDVVRLDAKGWTVLALVALCGGLVGTLAIVKALFLVNFDRLSVVVLLQKLQPVFAILLAAILLRERLQWRFLGWAALAMVGAYVLTFGLGLPDLGPAAATTEAALWALVAAAAFGSATVLGKFLLGRLDFRSATFARYGLTSLFALVAMLATDVGMPLASLTPEHWLLVLVIGLTTGSGAIFLYYRGLTSVRASVAAICELCLPLSAVLLDYVINRSRLGPWQWLGAVVLIGAIVRITARPAQE